MADAATKPAQKKGRHEAADGGQLSWKQQEFLRHFATGITATEACRRAGYSERSARSTAFDLLRHPIIKRELEAIRAKLREQTLWAAADSFEELGRIMDAAEAAGHFSAAVKAAEQRARVHGLMVDKQKVDVTVEVIDISGALAEARARILRPRCDPAQIEDAEYTAQPSGCDARPGDCESLAALPAPSQALPDSAPAATWRPFS